MAGNQTKTKDKGTKKAGRKVKQNGNGTKTDPEAQKRLAGLLARQDMAALFREKLDQCKVTDEKIARAISGALSAMQVRVFHDKDTVIYSKRLKDHQTRLKAAELAARLKGYEPAKKLDIDADIGFKGLSDNELNARITDLLRKAGTAKPTGRAGPKKKKT